MQNDYEKRLLRVIDHIYENVDQDLSLDALADVAAMSRFHWHRVFHAVTGETCAAAVRRIRLHRGACWLVQRDWSQEEVARRLGYGSQQSFIRAFRSAYGVSPGAFRKIGKIELPQMLRRKGDLKMFPVEIQNAPKRRLVGLPHRGAYMDIGQTFEKLSAIVTSRNLWPQVRGMLGMYFDDPDAVAEAELRSFAGVDVAEDLPLPEGFEELRIAAGPVAVLHYKGPYAGLKEAYTYLYGEWLPNSGRELSDQPCYEVYLNSPDDTAPADLLTDICVGLVA
ncbi:MAG: AraC family transcriptional regulator [Rhodobacterales bacterium]|nr:MAG: AraC family transcriptional regulator [Rhodobacterales bacterium]